MTETPRTPDERLVAELEQVALAPAASGRAAIAKTTALRTLMKLGVHLELSPCEKRLWSADRDENERVRMDDWHPLPDSGWVEVDSVDTVEKRRRRWRAEFPGRNPYPGRGK
jgi:hypothetical protein